MTIVGETEKATSLRNYQKRSEASDTSSIKDTHKFNTKQEDKKKI